MVSTEDQPEAGTTHEATRPAAPRCDARYTDEITKAHAPSTEAYLVGRPDRDRGYEVLVAAQCTCGDPECGWSIAAPRGRWVHSDAWGEDRR